MQGREDHKKALERMIEKKLEKCPKYVSNFYYNMGTAGRSHTTKKNYINHIISFLDYYKHELKLKDIKDITMDDIKKIDSTDVDKYMYYQSWKGGSQAYETKDKDSKVDTRQETSATYRATKLSALNSFFTYLYKTRLISENPIQGRVERPHVPRSRKKVVFLEEDEIQTVINNVLNGVGSEKAKKLQEKWKYRDLLLVLMPIYTGLRVTALSEINVEDIYYNEWYIMATDKRNKTKERYIDYTLEKLIERWMKDRKEILGDTECSALFISEYKTRMHTNSIRKVIDKYTYNIDKHITPHKLRATGATNLYRKTKDIYIVQDFLDHESPVPTKFYTDIEDESKKSVPQTIGRVVNLNLSSIDNR